MINVTQQGDHHPVLNHLHGAAGQVENILHHVPRVDEILVWGTEGGFDSQ